MLLHTCTELHSCYHPDVILVTSRSWPVTCDIKTHTPTLTCALPSASVHLVRDPGVASWNNAAPFPLAMFPAKVQFVYEARLALRCKPCSQVMRDVCLLPLVWFASKIFPNVPNRE